MATSSDDIRSFLESGMNAKDSISIRNALISGSKVAINTNLGALDRIYPSELASRLLTYSLTSSVASDSQTGSSSSDVSDDVKQLFAQMNNNTATQLIQNFYDLYMSSSAMSDINYRLGKVTGETVSEKTDSLLGTSSSSVKPYQMNKYGELYTRANACIEIPVSRFSVNSSNGIGTGSDLYTNLFFPPYKSSEEPASSYISQWLNDSYFKSLMDSSVTYDLSSGYCRRDKFTYRLPAFKAVNDNISFLQYIMEQCTGIVSTYLTEWDLSMYIQEGLISENKSNVIYLLNRIRQDNPLGYSNDRALQFGNLNACVSKLFRDNERAFNPNESYMSPFWTRYDLGIITDVTTGKNIYVPDFYGYRSDSQSSDRSVSDMLKAQDYLGAAMSGWTSWQSRYYNILYSSSGDGLSAFDTAYLSALAAGLTANQLISLNNDVVVAAGGIGSSAENATLKYPLTTTYNAFSTETTSESNLSSEEAAAIAQKSVGGYATADSILSSLVSSDNETADSVTTSVPTTGIPQRNPYLFGGPHGAVYSPRTLQGYFQNGNYFLGNTPRADFEKGLLPSSDIRSHYTRSLSTGTFTEDSPMTALRNLTEAKADYVNETETYIARSLEYRRGTNVGKLYRTYTNAKGYPQTTELILDANNAHKVADNVYLYNKHYYIRTSEIVQKVITTKYSETITYVSEETGYQAFPIESLSGDTIYYPDFNVKTGQYTATYAVSDETASAYGANISDARENIGAYYSSKYQQVKLEKINGIWYITQLETGTFLLGYTYRKVERTYSKYNVNSYLNAKWHINIMSVPHWKSAISKQFLALVTKFSAALPANAKIDFSTLPTQPFYCLSIDGTTAASYQINASTSDNLEVYTINRTKEEQQFIQDNLIDANGYRTVNMFFCAGGDSIYENGPSVIFRAPVKVMRYTTTDRTSLPLICVDLDNVSQVWSGLDRDGYTNINDDFDWSKGESSLSGDNLPDYNKVAVKSIFSLFLDNGTNSYIRPASFQSVFSMSGLGLFAALPGVAPVTTGFINQASNAKFLKIPNDGATAISSLDIPFWQKASDRSTIMYFNTYDCRKYTSQETFGRVSAYPGLKKALARLYTTCTFYKTESDDAYRVAVDTPVRTLLNALLWQKSFLSLAKTLFVENISWETVSGMLSNNIEESVLNADEPKSVVYNYWIQLAKSIFQSNSLTKSAALDLFKLRISRYNAFINVFAPVCKKTALQWTVTDYTTVCNVFREIKSFSLDITASHLAKELSVESYMEAYLNVLYEYRKYFINARFNKQNGTMWMEREIESIIPAFVSVKSKNLGDNVVAGGNSTSSLPVAMYEVQNTVSSKVAAIADASASLSEDRIKKLYIKVSYTTESEHTGNPKGSVRLSNGKYAKLPSDGQYYLDSLEKQTADANAAYNTLHSADIKTVADTDKCSQYIYWGDSVSKTPVLYGVLSGIDTNAISQAIHTGSFSQAFLTGDPTSVLCASRETSDYWTVTVSGVLPRASGYVTAVKIKMVSSESGSGSSGLESVTGIFSNALYPVTKEQASTDTSDSVATAVTTLLK